jgi:uncharacterized Ntn-hydrolase superfamily protein
MTFSIVARSVDRRCYGVAIASSSPAVAARCAHARAGAGAVASQNITDPRLGPRTLDALARRLAPAAAIQDALSSTAFGDFRQLLAIGPEGPPAIHSGSHALGVVGQAVGADAASAGNLLARADVPEAMVAAFAASTGPLGARLLAALEAGLALGGEAGAVHSAGLLVVRDVEWPIVDLRVDWSDGNPIAELAAAYRIYEPQIEDYVRRAMEPGSAPKFGVPGDL